MIASAIKALEQFRNYILDQVVGILKSHEAKIMEDLQLIPNVGPLALIAKEYIVKGKKSNVIVNSS